MLVLRFSHRAVVPFLVSTLTTICILALPPLVGSTNASAVPSALPVPGFTLSQSIPGSWAGVAWANAYGDFKPELAMTGTDGNYWYFYSAGMLVGGGGIGPSGTPQGIAWGDYDDDGLMDVVSLSSSKGAVRAHVYHNESVGDFIETTAEVFPIQPSQCRGLGWGDFDRDWDLDLGVARQGGSGSSFYGNDGSMLQEGIFWGGETGTGIAIGDYDNDRWPDVYVSDLSLGGGHLVRNALGTGVDVTTPTLGNAGGKGYHAEWADYDNDGDLDLFVANSATGGGDATSRLYRNENSTAAGFVDVTVASGIVADRGTGAWGDFDNDGHQDIYVQHSAGNRLYRNLGDGTFTDVTGGAPLNVVADGGIAWADYDADGYLDLAVASSSGASIFHSNGHTNHWLHVDLVGTISSRWGIGARIQVVTGGLRQTREVSGSAGYLGQNSITAEFGLGLATTVDSVIVTWPTGVRQVVSPPAVDQRISVIETGSTGVEEAAPTEYRLSVVGPNPFWRSTTFSYSLPRREHVKVEVFDLAGRRVQTLASHVEAAGLHRVAWDGTDDHGKRVSAGVYLCRLHAGTFAAVRRVVLAP